MQFTVEQALAFTHDGTGGNPAGVVLEAGALAPAVRQAIAAAVGWSETAFVTEQDGVLSFEFYTPVRQIRQCGHATAAALGLLRASGRLAEGSGTVRIDGNAVAFHVAGERVELALGRARITAADVAPADLAELLGVEPVQLAPLPRPTIVDTGSAFLHVAVEGRRALQDLVPDEAAIAALSERLGLVGVFAYSLAGAAAGCHVVARMFAPAFGIPEEAATGVAAGGLAALLREHGSPVRDILVVEQGSMMTVPSPARLEARVVDGVVRVGGSYRAIGRLQVEVDEAARVTVRALEAGRRRAHFEDLRPALAAASAAANEYLEALPSAPAAREPARLAQMPLGAPAGAEGALAQFRARYEATFSASAGPRYWGFVTGGATPAALAADWLASAYDQNASNDVGSGATDAEREALDWLREIFELPAAFRGVMVTGATMANTTALATARQWVGARAGIDVAAAGLTPPLRPRVLAGSAHSSIYKALAILGIGRDAVQVVPTQPGRAAVDLDALEAALAAQPDRPTIVVASAGEVNTGDFDDLRGVALRCRRHEAWLHVDAAFGMFAALDPRRRHRLDGVDLADSITVDLHKWLNVPYDAGVVFCRHRDQQRQVFRASAAYLGDDDDPLHLTPENSRRLRALPLWVSLKAYGREGIAEWVGRSCALAERLARHLSTLPVVQVLSPVHLNIVCFSLAHGDAAARDRFLARITASGEVFLTPTTFAGRPAVRAALSNWSTDAADVDRAVAAIAYALGDATPGL